MITAEELLALNASFKSFDADGNNSIDEEELRKLLFTFAIDETLAEIDKEVELIIQAVDKDGNRQLSYAEFFSAQKNNTIPPAAKDALDKLTKFLTKPLEERNKISINNKENFDRLIREKEEAIRREAEEKQKEGHDTPEKLDESEVEQSTNSASPVSDQTTSTPTGNQDDIHAPGEPSSESTPVSINDEEPVQQEVEKHAHDLESEFDGMEKLKLQVSEYKKVVATKNEENDQLKNQLDSAHKDIENFKRRTDDQAIQIRDLQDEMKTKDETNRFKENFLQEQLEDTKQQLALKELANQDDTPMNLEADLHDTQFKLGEAKDENKKLRLEISSLNERCENLRKEGGSAILDVHAKQDHIDRTQKEHNAERERLENIITEKTADIQRITTDNERLQREVLAREEIIKARSQELEQSKIRSTLLDKELNNYKLEDNITKERIRRDERDKRDREWEYSKNDDLTKELKEKVQRLEKEREDSAAELIAAEQQISRKTTEISVLENRVNEQIAQNARNNESLTQIRTSQKKFLPLYVIWVIIVAVFAVFMGISNLTHPDNSRNSKSNPA